MGRRLNPIPALPGASTKRVFKFNISAGQAGVLNCTYQVEIYNSYWISGTFLDYSGNSELCFTITATLMQEPPPIICTLTVCFDRPHCPPSRPGSERESRTSGYTERTFNLIPNPATDQVRLDGIAAPTDLLEVRLTDVLGRYNRIVRVTGDNPTLDISTLPDGVYIVTITDEHGARVSRKMTVMR
jgi:hypothetical protein